MTIKQLQNLLLLCSLFVVIWLGIGLFAHFHALFIWGAAAALLVMMLIYLGLSEEKTPLWYGVLVEKNRNRASLSRLQVTLWTVVIISAYLAVALIRTMPEALDPPAPDCQETDEDDCTPQPLNIAFPNEIWLALGISTVSFAGSSLIKTNKRNKYQANLLAQPSPETAIIPYQAKEPKIRDIFYGDDVGNQDTIDLSKVQMFFFTVALITVYSFAIGSFITNDALIRAPHTFEFPAFSSSMTVILAISHAGYLFIKGPGGK
ncbi:MAG: hypothetical protein HUU38_16855 [Anaerolineales bacterium]|jgi:hypothetical protein|nr:hypothetical protein [Anaerolineales bacterium]